jgi:large subunit ribosomal protein L24
MAKMKIKKGDLVQVTSGRSKKNGGDRGKQGKVIAVFPDTQRVLVEGVNQMTRHTKTGTTGRGARTGGIVTQEAPLHVSNVAIVDPETKSPTRVRTRLEMVERDGRQKVTRIRVAVRSGKDLS